MSTVSQIRPGKTRLSAQDSTFSAATGLDSCAAVLQLRRHQHAKFQGLQDWHIHALGGTVWITQDGDRRDIILEAGDSFRVESNAAVMIGALGDASVGVCRPNISALAA